MSIFGEIMSSIFGKESATGGKTSPPATDKVPTTAGSTTGVDVADILSRLAAAKEENLDWRRSIVDLMKLLDSSPSARKELAHELAHEFDYSRSMQAFEVALDNSIYKKIVAATTKELSVEDRDRFRERFMKFSTDMRPLVVGPSFIEYLAGAATAMNPLPDTSGKAYPYSDRDALASDWRAVHDDMIQVWQTFLAAHRIAEGISNERSNDESRRSVGLKSAARAT